MTKKEQEKLQNMKEQLERIYNELNTLKLKDKQRAEAAETKHYSSNGEGEELLNVVKGKDEEIEFWKNRCRVLSLKFADAIKSLKAESQNIKQEMFSSIVDIAKETESMLRKYLNNPKTVRARISH